jgi:peptide/nickel transport system ATP-binding protein
MTLLRVSGLRVTGPNGTIVDRLDLTVAPGETVAIVGESGSGKSMTAKALTGLLPAGVAASGSIEIAGVRIELGAPAADWRAVRGSYIALLLQDPFTSLSPVHRCGEQIGWAIADRRVRKKRVAQLLAEVGLAPSVADRYPFELSGGMRQRVAIAAGLAADPQLLIADEPTTALDVTTQHDVLELIAALQRERQMGLILITHDLRVARSRADRIMVMYAGRLVEQGPAAEVLRAPAHPYTSRLLGCDPPLEHRLVRLPAIAGSVPQPFTVGDSCAFASRCDLVTDECRIAAPELVEVACGHQSACIRPERAALPAEAERVAAEPAPESGPALLRVSGLTKRFAGAEVAALDGVDFHIAEGESVAVVGESGSGKTTLARCIVGLERPDGGRIDFHGRVSGPQRVQIVFQDPYSALNPGLTVGGSLREALRAVRRPTAEFGELLELVGLPPSYAGRRPRALSGGERQRVAIARALAARAQLLILDESVSALDVSVQAQMLNLLVDLQRRLGLTLLFITHDLAVARQIAGRVYVMHRGQVVEEGQTADVLTKPQAPYTQRLIASIPSTS